VRLIDQLHAQTVTFHADADEDALQLLGPASAHDYQRFLTRRFGFVAPLEHMVVGIDGIEHYVDVRRFTKHELLRRDLMSFRMTAAEVDQLPRCPLPVLTAPEEALGWAYVIERSTLGHSNLFHHLASIIPGEVAFSSSYLKCYFGALGEMWRGFGHALEVFSSTPSRSMRVLQGARGAFRTYRTWRHLEKERAVAESRFA